MEPRCWNTATTTIIMRSRHFPLTTTTCQNRILSSQPLQIRAGQPFRYKTLNQRTGLPQHYKLFRLGSSVLSNSLSLSFSTTTSTNYKKGGATEISQVKPIADDDNDDNQILLRQQEALGRLPEVFPEMEFSNNRYELERHGRGESYHASQPPGMIVYCRSTQQVQQVMQYCIQHGIPMIPFGAGTSLEGHVQAVKPCTLCIDLAKYMTTIHSIPDPSSASVDPYAVVDAGVTRLQLQAALKHSGYLFSVDPGADATLGGMASTGASGTTTVKWGTMKDNVLSVTAVLATTPDAPIVETGTKALKNSAGYDLTSLLCGSEGTLGIITQLTVRLHPVPAHLVAVSCTFPTLHQAAEAVSTLLQCNVDMVRCELLDATSMQVFDTVSLKKATTTPESKPTPPENYKPALFLELAGVTEVALREQVNLVRELLVLSEEEGEPEHKQEFRLAYDTLERQELWKARHGLYYNAIAAGGGAGAQAIVTDACVPLSQLANVIVATADDVAKEGGVLGPCFGHAGDGNFHCILAIPPQYALNQQQQQHDESSPRNAGMDQNEPNKDANEENDRTSSTTTAAYVGITSHQKANDRQLEDAAATDNDDTNAITMYWNKLRRIQKSLIRRTLAVGGTCTGEHGIGITKRRYLVQQYTPETLHTMKLLKQALDPYHLLNPGKIFFSSPNEQEEVEEGDV